MYSGDENENKMKDKEENATTIEEARSFCGTVEDAEVPNGQNRKNQWVNTGRFIAYVLRHIKENGIQKRTRNFVHLSKDERTAYNVGKRHGEPVVLTIRCAQMSADGYKFYLSENGVYLTEFVPGKYIMNAPTDSKA